MSDHKSPALRYRIIDELLNQVGDLKFKEILDKLNKRLEEKDINGVKVRQLRQDFLNIKKIYGVKIKCIKPENYYAYEKAGFSILTKNLNEKQTKIILRSLDKLKQFKADDFYKQLEGLIQGIGDKKELKSRKTEEESKPVMVFEEIPKIKNFELIPQLEIYIKNKNCLNISYKPFGKEIENYNFSPYLLKEFNRRWYLYGKKRNQYDIFNLAIDRIQKVETVEDFLYEEYNQPQAIESLYQNMLGVTKPQDHPELKEVLLKVQKPRAKYIETKPIHPRQEIVAEDETSISFSYKLYHNKELEAKILEFGKDIEVLRPEALRKNIHNILLEACQKYEP